MSQTDPAGTDAGALFRAGKLTDAVAAANAAVKKSPADIGVRILLSELLVFAGNLERADVILDACGDMDPSVAVVVAEFRQLVRGEMARRQLFREGRLPEFLGLPTETQRHALASLVALRAGDVVEAGRLAAEAETARVHPSGKNGTAAFDDLRDADDVIAGSVEVITTTGKYFWIPAERITLLEFHKPKRPRDLFWRRCTMEVADGPDGEVYVPATYSAEGDVADEFRLGRATDWTQSGEAGPVRGTGGVTWLVGEEAVTVMELEQLTFAATP